MPKEIWIHFEGSNSLKEGFHAFFREFRERGAGRFTFRWIASRSGPEACRGFHTALKTHPKAWNILVIDSDGPDRGNLSASLCEKQHWRRSYAHSIFWMVQMMEAWFHADKDALKRFYSAGFRENSLSRNLNVEEIPKRDLEAGLKAATKDTFGGKGEYFRNKTLHGPKLLALIDPKKVREAAPHCEEIFAAVLAKLKV